MPHRRGGGGFFGVPIAVGLVVQVGQEILTLCPAPPLALTSRMELHVFGGFLQVVTCYLLHCA